MTRPKNSGKPKLLMDNIADSWHFISTMALTTFASAYLSIFHKAKMKSIAANEYCHYDITRQELFKLD